MIYLAGVPVEMNLHIRPFLQPKFHQTHARGICSGIETSSATDLFATDTTVVLTWAFTQMACFRTINTATADCGLRSVEAVTM
ncbi:hypothetical protein A6V36_09735 [Paraburkholderia ginsengiterrae]|uniref:Uncharacterized protein n=1 Tax=Paraburkholderia ginsengiterrae TaxID=1462993 RepID=A0A1A9NIB8_9BURK|nr:hypothetical protein A6V36_09735 [Paraburkholderia ginsengiterrae]OAJ65894.1 hypothetical protein A6V37_13105 [Paraburkholderia ginsengiterrae]